jgi:lipopolysaccharide transport system permease protein
MWTMREWLKELLHHRELLYFFVWRDLKVRYHQTLLGAGWAILQPLLAMIVFSVVFGRLAKMPSDGVPYPLFVYSGLVVWTYFANAVTQGGNSLAASSNLLTKVYFPRAAIPLASVLCVLVDTLVASVFIGALMVFYGIPVSAELPLALLVLVIVTFCASGFSLLLSAINVEYRDVKYATPFLVQVWMFLTPIIYPMSIVPENLRPWMALNPLAGMVEAFRAALLPEKFGDWQLLATSCASTIVICAIGLIYFRRAERTFADVV